MPRQPMKRILIPASLALTLAIFAACDEGARRPPNRRGGFHPTNPTTVEKPKPEPGDEVEKPERHEKPEKPTPNEPVVKPVPDAPVHVGEIPYGKAVPGKQGFVFSPSDQLKYIDVRGFPPGTEVKDPYSGKSFLVP